MRDVPLSRRSDGDVPLSRTLASGGRSDGNVLLSRRSDGGRAPQSYTY